MNPAPARAKQAADPSRGSTWTDGWLELTFSLSRVSGSALPPAAGWPASCPAGAAVATTLPPPPGVVPVEALPAMTGRVEVAVSADRLVGLGRAGELVCLLGVGEAGDLVEVGVPVPLGVGLWPEPVAEGVGTLGVGSGLLGSGVGVTEGVSAGAPSARATAGALSARAAPSRAEPAHRTTRVRPEQLAEVAFTDATLAADRWPRNRYHAA